MRKVLVVIAFLAALPTMGFAQLAVGPASFLRSPELLGQSADVEQLNVDQFSIGGDLRYRFAWFQAQGVVLYSTGEVNSLDVFLGAGMVFDIAFVSLSLGAGPNFTKIEGHGPPMQAGLNAKAGADVRLGPVSLGVSYIMALRVAETHISVETSCGLLGVQLLYWLW